MERTEQFGFVVTPRLAFIAADADRADARASADALLPPTDVPDAARGVRVATAEPESARPTVVHSPTIDRPPGALAIPAEGVPDVDRIRSCPAPRERVARGEQNGFGSRIAWPTSWSATCGTSPGTAAGWIFMWTDLTRTATTWEPRQALHRRT